MRTAPGAGSLNVLMVTPRYPPFVGGVENHTYQVARRLAARGIRVTVLTTDPRGSLPAQQEQENVCIRRVRAWPSGRDYYFAPDMYRIISGGGWDIVHVQSFHTLVAPIAMLAAWRAGLPYVVTFHSGGNSSQLRNALRGTQRQILRPLLSRAARLIAVAQFEADLFARSLHLPPDRFILIRNGSDLDPPANKPAPRNAHLIASIGRLERYKGHQRVIAALPHVLAQYPDARLWIAGNGPYESRLRRQAKQLGVAEQVDIRAISGTDRANMAAELSRVALITLLSDYETEPLAVLEGLAMGCAGLVSDTSGMSELADQGLVTAIPLRSTPQRVADAILELLREPRIPPAGALRSWDDCAQDLLSLYRSIVGRPSCVS